MTSFLFCKYQIWRQPYTNSFTLQTEQHSLIIIHFHKSHQTAWGEPQSPPLIFMSSLYFSISLIPNLLYKALLIKSDCNKHSLFSKNRCSVHMLPYCLVKTIWPINNYVRMAEEDKKTGKNEDGEKSRGNKQKCFKSHILCVIDMEVQWWRAVAAALWFPSEIWKIQLSPTRSEADQSLNSKYSLSIPLWYLGGYVCITHYLILSNSITNLRWYEGKASIVNSNCFP